MSVMLGAHHFSCFPLFLLTASRVASRGGRFVFAHAVHVLIKSQFCCVESCTLWFLPRVCIPGLPFPGCPGIPDISITEFPGMKLTQLEVMASRHAFRYSRAPGNPGNDVCAFPIPGNEKTGPIMQTLYLPAPVGRAVLTSASLLTERDILASLASHAAVGVEGYIQATPMIAWLNVAGESPEVLALMTALNWDVKFANERWDDLLRMLFGKWAFKNILHEISWLYRQMQDITQLARGKHKFLCHYNSISFTCRVFASNF